MATDKSKIGSGVLLRADGTEMSASPVAESSMQDEGGYVFLRLAIIVERDIISQCGFYTAPEIPGSIVDAMSAIAEAAEGKAIMAAALISGERIKSALSELKLSDSELKKSADIAALMLHECLRNYSMKYNQARQQPVSKCRKALITLAFLNGTPDGIRTHDLQSRSLTLYPAELRAHL